MPFSTAWSARDPANFPSEITPVGKEINKLLNDKSYLIKVLQKGKEKANIIAEENLKNIREKVGLI